MSALVPALETPRLRLRALTRRDFEAEAAWFARPGSARNGGPKPREAVWRVVAAMIGHWTLEGVGFWAVERSDTRAYCGRVGVWSPEGWPEPELGWTFTDGADDLAGAEAEAILAARDWAWRERALGPLASLIRPSDGRARRLAAAVGARMERSVKLPEAGLVEIDRHALPGEALRPSLHATHPGEGRA
ncbi:MAG: GNAT family N-acetyltransferase [Paracoccaceae bacterium]